MAKAKSASGTVSILGAIQPHKEPTSRPPLHPAQVLVRLLMLKFDPVTEPATRLQQCLPVFFDTYAAMPLPRQQPCSQQYLSTVLLQAAHW